MNTQLSALDIALLVALWPALGLALYYALQIREIGKGKRK